MLPGSSGFADAELERSIGSEWRTGPVAEAFKKPQAAERQEQWQHLGKMLLISRGATTKSVSESVEKYHFPRVTCVAAS